ncbi:MAG: class I SAM-dependent DNA methyltransferase [Bacillota bacterium]|uniref:class I SAM-dependent DNA methyltransferase n=1 Tax=Virgibacillus TaxID=84406 RepID=UPI000EF47F25|nr:MULTISPECIES: class I SAM-dependent methyltransferase [Virgibacillus]MCC2248359.1 methyltransferase domain-containing protein [Virgibacillus sp. AGTR]MDY7045218.1 methyltransferase domain-containing protein [Virgibacillus sp. M23]QRZ16425.1 methyltransferase domain-containing protein [Virgibacillus sp. AGTR]WBX80083.1 methyltransferase domain-containing protein [Virgibacillus salarius]
MGREFLSIFDDWANTYDLSVAGVDQQYAAVFSNYDKILDEVVEHSEGNVLEFGVGTGNLSKKLIEAGHSFIGVEPSLAMREIAKEKLGDVEILDGDFLSFPAISESINTIVSTYAFHHLTDKEKEVAISNFSQMLPKDGRIVFGDTIFQSDQAKELMIEQAKRQGYLDLADDLQREYYPTITVLKNIFTLYNFNIAFHQMNDFVWLLLAKKN